MRSTVSNLRSAHPAQPQDAPLYKEVRRNLLQCLAKSEWAPGEQLPTEPELAARFGVAIPTVRAGAADLVAAGVLIRRQGKGTFVARHSSSAQEFRFSNIFNARNENISTRRTRVSVRKVKPDADIAHVLALDVRDPGLVQRVDAILEADGTPVGLMDLVLPLPLFAKLTKADLEQSADNLYSVYQRVCGVTVLRMEERIYARTADKDTARALQVKIGHPIIVVDRLAYTFDERPVEIRRRSFEGLQHYYLFTHKAVLAGEPRVSEDASPARRDRSVHEVAIEACLERVIPVRIASIAVSATRFTSFGPRRVAAPDAARGLVSKQLLLRDAQLNRCCRCRLSIPSFGCTE